MTEDPQRCFISLRKATMYSRRLSNLHGSVQDLKCCASAALMQTYLNLECPSIKHQKGHNLMSTPTTKSLLKNEEDHYLQERQCFWSTTVLETLTEYL